MVCVSSKIITPHPPRYGGSSHRTPPTLSGHSQVSFGGSTPSDTHRLSRQNTSLAAQSRVQIAAPLSSGPYQLLCAHLISTTSRFGPFRSELS